MRAPFAILVLAVGLAGCGGGTEEDQVRSAMEGFSHAFAGADGEKACELMTDAFKVQFTSNTGTDAKDCASAVRTAAARLDKPTADALRAVKVSNVSIAGDRATAEVSRSPGVNDTQPLRKVSGDWLVDAN